MILWNFSLELEPLRHSTKLCFERSVNIRWQQEDQSISLEEAHERAFQAYEGWQRIIRSVPPQLWNKEYELLAGIDDGRHWHYTVHRECIIVG